MMTQLYKALCFLVLAAFVYMPLSAGAQTTREQLIQQRMNQGKAAPNIRTVNRNGVRVDIDQSEKCENGETPYHIVSDTPDALPELSKIGNTLANSQPSIYCMKSGMKFFDVPVVKTDGTKTDTSFLYFMTGHQKFLFSYKYLKPADKKFLTSDPGLPLARVAPEFINISSGQYAAENYRLTGDNHWQAMAFQFARKDAKWCPDVVGKTKTYKLTLEQSDEYGTETTERVYEFDADWEKPMIQIIENGNHISGKLGLMASELIDEYGCKSEEIKRLRSAFEALFQRMDGSQ